jgi:ligand-binding sensor domain-containing protein/signal transduction histidine kinase
MSFISGRRANRIIFFGLVLLLAACSQPPMTAGQNAASQQAQKTAARPDASEAIAFQPILSPGLAGSELRLQFRRLSLNEGLSHSVVYRIFEDSQGYIWAGTADGLNRFDGYRFTQYRYDPLNPESISSNTIWEIFEDSRGDLWIGTDKGLNLFNRVSERFKRYSYNSTKADSLAHDHVGEIFEDSRGELWIGTWGGGLDHFDRVNERFIHYRNDPNNAESLSSNNVGGVFEDANGVLWIATENSLDKLDLASGKFQRHLFVQKEKKQLWRTAYQAMMADDNGSLWMTTYGSGLLRFDLKRERFEQFRAVSGDPNSISSNIVWDIEKDPSGALWIGTEEGLDLFWPQSESFTHYDFNPDNPDDAEALSSPTVYDIHRDRSGVYWLATYGGGINQFNLMRQGFTHYHHKPDDTHTISNDNVTAILEDARGYLWVGTVGGVNRIDRKSGYVVHYNSNPKNPYSLSSDHVNAMFQDKQGQIWIGTENGLNRYNDKFDRIFPYEVIVASERGSLLNLKNVSITAICQDSDGILWLGTDGYGLIYLDVETNQAVMFVPESRNPYSINSKYITAVYQDRTGFLWVGTSVQGLNRYDRSTGRFLRFTYDSKEADSLSDNTVTAIFQSRTGTIWVGTMGGLNKYDRATAGFIHYRERDGLPSDVICGIVEDEQGYLWMSLSNGITRFDPRRETFKNFNRQDGLQSNQFNKGAYFGSSSGEMFFGGINGLNAFRPEKIKDNPYIPPVVLTSLTQGNEPMETKVAVGFVDQINLHWPNNFFEFSFAALSYIQPEKNQYAYKLENFDKGWIYAGTNRSGRYTNLPGGDYTLRIKGSNNDGVWNEEGIALKITVVPPIWQRAWFQWAAVLAAAGIIFAGYQMRVREINLRNRRLALQVAERTREIEQRRKVAEGLREILLLINSNKSLGESLNFICCQVGRMVRADRVCLYQNGSGGRRKISALYDRRDNLGEPCRREAELKMICPDKTVNWFGSLVEDGSPRVIDDLSLYGGKRPDLAPAIMEGIQTVLILPIESDNEIIGGLAALFEKQRRITKDEIELLASIADQAALAIGNDSLRSKAEELAVVSERNRLARDLHDAVTQTLFSASLIAEAIPALWENDAQEGQKLLYDLRQLTRGALAEMRTLLMELRPSAVIEAKLPDLLKQLAESVIGKTGMTVDLHVDEIGNLPDDIHVGFYRIAQEALTNVVKHAGARHVRLALMREKDDNGMGKNTVVLDITDDGCGFNPDEILPDHFGLVNIRERAQNIGAIIEINSQPGQGTQVRAIWQETEEVIGE